MAKPTDLTDPPTGDLELGAALRGAHGDPLDVQRGSNRSSHSGIHQFRLPSSCITAGTSTIRTTGRVEEDRRGEADPDSFRNVSDERGTRGRPRS